MWEDLPASGKCWDSSLLRSTRVQEPRKSDSKQIPTVRKPHRAKRPPQQVTVKHVGAERWPGQLEMFFNHSWQLIMAEGLVRPAMMVATSLLCAVFQRQNLTHRCSFRRCENSLGSWVSWKNLNLSDWSDSDGEDLHGAVLARESCKCKCCKLKASRCWFA